VRICCSTMLVRACSKFMGQGIIIVVLALGVSGPVEVEGSGEINPSNLMRVMPP